MTLLFETLLAMGQNVLNHALSLDLHTKQQLTLLQNRCIAVHVTSLSKTIYVYIDTQQIFLSVHAPKPEDVRIESSVKNLWQLSQKTPTPQQAVKMQGNMHVAQQFSHVISTFHPDWEEAITHLFGDVAGHALAQSMRHAQAYIKQTADFILRQSADYLVDEDPMIASKPSIEYFIDEVNQARTQCDRLLVRARLCQQRVETRCLQ